MVKSNSKVKCFLPSFHSAAYPVWSLQSNTVPFSGSAYQSQETHSSGIKITIYLIWFTHNLKWQFEFEPWMWKEIRKLSEEIFLGHSQLWPGQEFRCWVSCCSKWFPNNISHILYKYAVLCKAPFFHLQFILQLGWDLHSHMQTHSLV